MKVTENENITILSKESLKDNIVQKDSSKLSEMKRATIKIFGISHEVLINSDGYINGYKSDYMLIGKYFENKYIIYILDGDKYNSYLTKNDETIEEYIDGTIGASGKDTVKIEFHETSLEEIANNHLNFLKIWTEYMKTNRETFETVSDEINQLDSPSKENSDQLVFDEIFEQYKESIIKLKKRIN